ncbi:MAG: CRP/FNR family cyclic AMP-dependent transcriptional regulator [Planctomycetota bacterium]|jgi:CRP/FNR family cyclic AMP-dependent transcriptional regulator
MPRKAKAILLTPFQNRAQDALAENAFFNALSRECLSWTRRTSLRKGEALFEKGDTSDRLFGLVGGQMKLCSATTEIPSAARPVVFGIIAPGEMLGELGFTDGAPRHATAVALAHSELLTIDRGDLEPMMEQTPELRALLGAACSASAQRLSERIEDAAYLSIEARVEKALRDCAQRFGIRTENGGTLVPLRQQDLADVLGLSRASINKILTSSAMAGRVELGRGRIVLFSV